MSKSVRFLMCSCGLLLGATSGGTLAGAPEADWRNIRTGKIIPDKTYSDQPYIVQTDDGAWLCAMTTGSGMEGATGQHIITQRSFDQGETWVDRVEVEPPEGPEASYAVLLKVPSGRVYVFYNHNTDNVRSVIADDPPYAGGRCERVDSLGYYVFKYSDDHGRTWSEERFPIPQRNFEIDRHNAYGGELKFFWNVGKPFVHEGAGLVPIHKVGGFGYNFFTSNEGALLRSDNILTETDPRKIRWETLPEGDVGLRTPAGGGPIAAEQSFSVLSDGSIYVVYRSIDGHPVYSYSRDGGRTWGAPAYKRYANGRLMKHPRAANFAWKTSNGKYLYWFHNHGGRSYDDRNPVWLVGGEEVESPAGRVIRWSQPEVLLYDEDTHVRMSYPDLVEENGEFFVTETQKDIARLHRLDRALLEGLWGQFTHDERVLAGLVLEHQASDGSTAPAPELPAFMANDYDRPDHGTKHLGGGFTIELSFDLPALTPGLVLADARASDGRGWVVRTLGRDRIELVMNDGRSEQSWACDPGQIQSGREHHVSIIVDGGPRLIQFVVDGVLNDGGEHRQFGWGRFSPDFRSANGADTITLAGPDMGQISALRIYDRYLTVSEAIGNYRAAMMPLGEGQLRRPSRSGY